MATLQGPKKARNRPSLCRCGPGALTTSTTETPEKKNDARRRPKEVKMRSSSRFFSRRHSEAVNARKKNGSRCWHVNFFSCSCAPMAAKNAFQECAGAQNHKSQRSDSRKATPRAALHGFGPPKRPPRPTKIRQKTRPDVTLTQKHAPNRATEPRLCPKTQPERPQRPDF